MYRLYEDRVPRVFVNVHAIVVHEKRFLRVEPRYGTQLFQKCARVGKRTVLSAKACTEILILRVYNLEHPLSVFLSGSSKNAQLIKSRSVLEEFLKAVALINEPNCRRKS